MRERREKTNEEVLQMARGCRELLTVIRRHIGFIRYILRGSGLERECLHGIIEGRRARGRQRQRLKYMDSIKELDGCGSIRFINILPKHGTSIVFITSY